MRLLLDTHTFLWHANGSQELSSNATALLLDSVNELHLSIASIWEISIKLGLKKLSLSVSFESFLTRAIHGYGLEVVQLSLNDCIEYEKLPFPLANHRDPFDRLLITQALRRGLTVVGTDACFDSYGVSRLW